ncbi:LysM peptidoglycan-binding domain-containing protein [Niallia sp. NCCP-28]|uniref:cell division suppressor protein YneA n=1 Tax=Niallia sp. NCCP-28 TaxID=2934712 RepID=UPI0020885845|nr:LysM peptidoglycan-binding domain-containing protein [Niallia sp. NCCP-28]GKU82750.1 cell division suppressor protein YneA [Niallia sp. NCCP-28]
MWQKIWTNYSYTIILFIFSILTCATIVLYNNANHDKQYVTIKVEQGDSLWSISEKYNGKYSMSKKQFIKWVETKNRLAANQLTAGKEIIIPIKAEDENIQLASD